MDTTNFDPENDHIPGEHVNEYWLGYAKKFDLAKHMRLNTSVKSAVDQGSAGWLLTVSDETDSTKKEYQIVATKLVVATGLTSQPSMPKLPGSEAFGAPIYHSSEFARVENGLGPYKKIALLGGAKFSWDIANAYASAGVQVEWIIRKSGHGPCWMMPSRVTPFKIIPERLFLTRVMTWLSPCIWEDGFSYLHNFFSQHWLGRKISDAVFNQMQQGNLARNGYDTHPETAKLKPWNESFFVGSVRGVLSYKNDIFELVRSGKIRVHIADISQLSHHSVHLSTGEVVEADVLICGTGWKDTPQLDFQTDKELGLPGHASPTAQEHIGRADAQIFQTCPKLQEQPTPRNPELLADRTNDLTPQPYRLYRFMVPPAFLQSRTLAFAGAYRCPATATLAQTQALWITAFLDNRIPSLRSEQASTKDEIASRAMYETVLHTQFTRWRYSRSFGARFPELSFDCLPYVDLLLRDVGVRSQRKATWFRERFEAYMPTDYVGIIDEYIALKEAED